MPAPSEKTAWDFLPPGWAVEMGQMGQIGQMGQMQAGDAIEWTCEYINTTTKPLVFGDSATENEMCILFGYIYPVRDQFVGHAPFQGQPMCK
jgi:hypothetical protein